MSSLSDALLIDVRVDLERVGAAYPHALAQIIEAHERCHCGLAARKDIHILIDRYAAYYFPAVTISWDDRRYVIKLLRRRYFTRSNAFFVKLLSERRSDLSE